MNKLNDELLNNYIDNELDAASIKEIKEKINNNEELLKNLKALKSVDESLKQIEVFPAPTGFTEKIMKLILSKSKSSVQKVNYFFVSVLSLFAVAIVSVLIIAYKLIEKSSGSTSSESVLDKTLTFIKEKSPNWQSLFTNDSIVMLGTVLTIILLISGFFMFESHKNFKNKLDRLSTRTL